MPDRTGHTHATPATRRTGEHIRLMGGLSLGALAAITAVISYQHGLDVVRATGTTGWVAYLVPLVPDLMIFASSLALLEAALHNARRPCLAIAALAFGIVATVAMNVASGWHHGTGGALVSALAPLALVLSYETLMGMVRRAREQVAGEPPQGHDEPRPGCPHGVAESVEEAAVLAYLHARDCAGEPLSQRQVADAFGVHRNKVAALVKEATQPEPGDPEPEPAGPHLNGHAPATADGGP